MASIFLWLYCHSFKMHLLVLLVLKKTIINCLTAIERDIGTNTVDNIVKAYKTSRHAEKCMNSTGRWVHGLTKLDTDCNHRNTAWNERLASTELFRTLKWNWPVVEEKKKSVNLWTNPLWCDSLTVLLGLGKKKTIKKKERRVFFLFFICFFGGGGKGIPVQCATQQPDSSCLCRRDILEKVLEQFLHWYFFTSEWVCRWALRLDLSANALLQWGQEKGFSPVGVEMREEVCQWLHTQRHCGLYIFVMVATQFRRQALLMTQKEKKRIKKNISLRVQSHYNTVGSC